MHETMVPMLTLRRAPLLGLVTLLVASTATAQTAPPPATSPPAATPDAPPPAAAPPPPITPLSPTLAPETQAPPLQLTERSALEQQPARPEPFYNKTWFWAVFGVAFLTGFIVTWAVLNDKASQPPHTTFGNMHAF
jgi:hypothetical protein